VKKATRIPITPLDSSQKGFPRTLGKRRQAGKNALRKREGPEEVAERTDASAEKRTYSEDNGQDTPKHQGPPKFLHYHAYHPFFFVMVYSLVICRPIR